MRAPSVGKRVWQNRPHEGLRHPGMPAVALSPNEMWGALLSVCGHVPLPLTGADYVELLPVVWKPITERGIRLDHRTYDHHALNPHRGPHDQRQVWVRLPDGQFTAVPWIHAEHVHQPLGDDLWQHLKTVVERRGSREQHEADLARALDDLLVKVRTGQASARERHLATRQAPAALPHGLDLGPAPGEVRIEGQDRRGRASASGGAAGHPLPADHVRHRDLDQDRRPAAGRGIPGPARAGTGDQPGGGQALEPPTTAQASPAGPRFAPWQGPSGGDGKAMRGGWPGEESLDELDADEDGEDLDGPGAWPGEETGGAFALYDAREEAELW
ncbi:hypothetical protein [Kitasatospora sp. NPDC047058]|uniref:hypothetical protein n=1 Tax=Kitasatospora sp. NPDC047058 TaxID=3155620 RepID=UPI0034054179